MNRCSYVSALVVVFGPARRVFRCVETPTANLVLCRGEFRNFAENHVGKRIAKEALIQIEVAPQAATVTMKRNGRIQRYSFLTACHLQKFWSLHFAFLTMQ